MRKILLTITAVTLATSFCAQAMDSPERSEGHWDLRCPRAQAAAQMRPGLDTDKAHAASYRAAYVPPSSPVKEFAPSTSRDETRATACEACTECCRACEDGYSGSGGRPSCCIDYCYCCANCCRAAWPIFLSPLPRSMRKACGDDVDSDDDNDVRIRRTFCCILSCICCLPAAIAIPIILAT